MAKYEPSADMRTFAKTLWDMREALLQQGFSKMEAHQMITDVLRTSLGQMGK